MFAQFCKSFQGTFSSSLQFRCGAYRKLLCYEVRCPCRVWCGPPGMPITVIADGCDSHSVTAEARNGHWKIMRGGFDSGARCDDCCKCVLRETAIRTSAIQVVQHSRMISPPQCRQGLHGDDALPSLPPPRPYTQTYTPSRTRPRQLCNSMNSFWQTTKSALRAPAPLPLRCRRTKR